MPTTNTDSILHYSIGDWAPLGLAVPNWSDDTHSQNSAILEIVSQVGRNLQALMCRPCARQRTPPKIDTLIEIHKLCVRCRYVMDSKAIPENKPNLEAQHTMPAPEVFLVYPTPFFLVRNPWMKRWCQLILTALSEAMQHTENARPLEISTVFAQSIGKFVERVYYQLAVELLRVPKEEAAADGFTIKDSQMKSYAPSTWFTATEMVDTVPSLNDWPTEDRLRDLVSGVPTVTLGNLGSWPLSSVPKVAGAVAADAAPKVASDKPLIVDPVT